MRTMRDIISGCNILLTIFGILCIMALVFIIGYKRGAEAEFQWCQEYLIDNTQEVAQEIDMNDLGVKAHGRVYRRGYE